VIAEAIRRCGLQSGTRAGRQARPDWTGRRTRRRAMGSSPVRLRARAPLCGARRIVCAIALP